MKINNYLLLIPLFALLLAGCGSEDLTPANTAPTQTDLIARTWLLASITIKTDAKSYTVPNPLATNEEVIFKKDGTYSYVEDNKPKAGTWKISGNKLTTVDADKASETSTINNLTTTNMDLATITVDLAKTTLTDEEKGVAFVAGILLQSLDKDTGGTIDFTKEPKAKTVQVITNLKAK